MLLATSSILARESIMFSLEEQDTNCAMVLVGSGTDFKR